MFCGFGMRLREWFVAIVPRAGDCPISPVVFACRRLRRVAWTAFRGNLARFTQTRRIADFASSPDPFKPHRLRALRGRDAAIADPWRETSQAGPAQPSPFGPQERPLTACLRHLIWKWFG